MALVGRHAELAEVDGLLERTASGTGALLVLVGAKGSGKTALIAAAANAARDRGFSVVGGSPTPGQQERSVWAHILDDVGAPAKIADALLAEASRRDVEAAVRILAGGADRLIVVDDIDDGGPAALEFLARLAGRLVVGSTSVIATARATLGIGRELRLRGISEDELAAVIGDVSQDVAQALWMASGGLPGVAKSLIAQLPALGQAEDPMVQLALHVRSAAQFLDVDVPLVRLLESATKRDSDDALQSRLLSRLARELLGDTSATTRRRQLVAEALMLARRAGDQQALSEALDAQLHALWDPAAVDDRLAAAAEIIALGREAGDDVQERHGMFWRFMALMELGRVAEAESVLAAFQRSATAAGDAEAIVMATSRHAMLAVLRGRFAEAERLIDEVSELGHRIGLPDTERLVRSLRGAISTLLGDAASGVAAVQALHNYARRMPGQLYEAMAARVLILLGREAEATAALELLLPQALAETGPRWLSAMADLAVVAAATGHACAAPLYDALLPYRGRLVVLGGANSVTGPASYYLGLLATKLGRLDEAVQHLEESIELDNRIGALPWLAESLDGLGDALTLRHSDRDLEQAITVNRQARQLAERLGMAELLQRLVRPADEWTLRRDGEDWVLEAGEERARLRDGLGLHQLRSLLAAPGREISALDLAAGGAGLIPPARSPVLDSTAAAAYRTRLAVLDTELDAADEVGDRDRAAVAETEREMLLAELRRTSGLGGRVRNTSAEAERARVNVTRNLRTALGRIASTAPRAAAHLQASVRTGLFCRYEPGPGGPTRWHV